MQSIYFVQFIRLLLLQLLPLKFALSTVKIVYDNSVWYKHIFYVKCNWRTGSHMALNVMKTSVEGKKQRYTILML